MPSLAATQPEYAGKSLRDLSNEIHVKMKDLAISSLARESVSEQPIQVFSPSDTYQKLLSDDTARVQIVDIANRVSGVMIVPYPPGIPVVMPGERFGNKTSAGFRYLLALVEFDRNFPGFQHEIHGIERDPKGNVLIRVLREPTRT
jgi:arginine decarboxylase